MGRPKIKLRSSDYPKLEAMASVGASVATCAKRLGFSRKTLDRILREDPRAHEAFEAGRGELESELVGALYKQAVDPKNKNPAPAIFLLKAVRGFVDVPQPQATENKVAVTFMLPAPLSREQWAKVIEKAPPKALKEINVDAS